MEYNTAGDSTKHRNKMHFHISFHIKKHNCKVFIVTKLLLQETTKLILFHNKVHTEPLPPCPGKVLFVFVVL